MNKDLRKSYEILDLPISSTIEDVETRQNALIKIEKSNGNIKKIEIIQNSATKIIENIKKNGIPKDNHKFSASNESLITLIIVFVFSLIACVLSFVIF